MATQGKDDGPGKETKKGMSSPYRRQSTTQSSKNASIPPSEKRPPNYLKATLSSGHLNPSSTPPSPLSTRIKQPSSSTSSNTAAATSRTHQYPHKPTLNRRRSFDRPPSPSTTATPHPLQKSQTFVSSHPSSAAGTDRRRRSLEKPPSPSRFHKSPQSNTTNSNSVKPIRKSNSLSKIGQTRSLKLAPKDGGKSYSLYTGINSFKITKDINPSTSSTAAASDADVSTTTTKAAPIITDSSPDHDHGTAAPTTEPQTGENQESLLVHSPDFEEVEDSDIDQLSTTESVPAAPEERVQVDLPEKKVQVNRHDDEDLKSYCDSSSTVLEDQNESMDVEIEGPGRDKERTLPVNEETNDQKEDRDKDENDNGSCSPAKEKEREEEEEEIGETENDDENENSSGKALDDQELEVNDQGNQPPEPDSEPKPEPKLELKPESEAKVEPEAEAEAKAEAQNVAGGTKQGGQGKKELAPVYNDVIEQTASKLLMKRKNKVKALVGAFETVMSLQEPEA